jgi:T5SS/PEP-CTERM-associated repeat protein
MLLGLPGVAVSASCPQPIVGSTDSDPPAPTDGLGLWAVQGTLVGGSITADCGGSIFVSGDAFLGRAAVDSSNQVVLVPGSITVKQRKLDGIVPPSVPSSPSSLEVKGRLTLGSKGEMRVESGGIVRASESWIGVATGAAGLDETGNVATVLVDGGPNVDKSAFEVGTVLVLGAKAGAPSLGTAADLRVRNQGTLHVGTAVQATDSTLSFADAGSRLQIDGMARMPALSLAGRSRLSALAGTSVDVGGQLQAFGTSVLDLAAAVRVANGVHVADNASLLLSGGASVDSALNSPANGTPEIDGLLIGASGEASSATALVQLRGAGTRWSNALDTTVGYASPGRLEILDGAVLENRDGSLGYKDLNLGYLYLDSNALVRGAGSSWANRAGLTIATLGGLTIDQGGAVASASATLYRGVVRIEGGGSKWTVTGDAVFIPQGPQLQLLIGDGGAFKNVDTYQVGGLVVIDGNGSRWHSAGNLATGRLGQARGVSEIVVRHGGALENNDGRIGLGNGSTVTVTGAGSSWVNHLDLRLGLAGNADVTVSAGALLSSRNGYVGFSDAADPQASGGFGKLVVTDADSAWVDEGALWVGFGSGRGRLEIVHGGAVYSRTGSVGYSVPNEAERAKAGVLIDGSGSSWSIAQSLDVGVGGTNNANPTGDLRVQGGGTLASMSARLGVRPTSTTGGLAAVVVDGPASSWVNTGNLDVAGGGFGGSAELRIQAGGSLSSVAGGPSRAATIGVGSTPTGGIPDGRVVVDGAGSTWTYHGDLEIGRNRGQGRLEVTGGGHVTTTGSVIAGEGADPFGIITTRATVVVRDGGSVWRIDGDLALGSVDAVGTLSVAGGGVVNVGGTVTVGAQGVLTLDGGQLATTTFLVLPKASFTWLAGTLSAVDVPGALANVSGVFSPGHSPALAHVQSYRQESGATLLMEIGGVVPGTGYDRLVAGDLVLDGTLDVRLIGGFAPQAGDRFDLLDWRTRSGHFAGVTLAQLPAGLRWDDSALDGEGILGVVRAPVPEASTRAMCWLGFVMVWWAAFMPRRPCAGR